MRIWPQASLVAMAVFVGCGHPGLPSTGDVQAFMGTVAHDVTEKGPAAWRRHFADNPEFFMAVNGHLAFPSGAAAAVGIQDVARSLRQIELRWGDDLRVDPLAPHLAAVAASYRELQVWADGRRVDETGFFKGVAETRDGRWQFRNVQWSSVIPPPSVR